jgi:hypothetical protein
MQAKTVLITKLICGCVLNISIEKLCQYLKLRFNTKLKEIELG